MRELLWWVPILVVLFFTGLFSHFNSSEMAAGVLFGGFLDAVFRISTDCFLKEKKYKEFTVFEKLEYFKTDDILAEVRRRIFKT